MELPEDSRGALRELYRISTRLLQLESIHLSRDWMDSEQHEYAQLIQLNEQLRGFLRQPLRG